VARRRPALLAALLAAAVLTTGCGFGLAMGQPLRGGVRRVEVGLLENRSGDPGLGATMAGALQRELARRGQAAGAGAADARLEGEVRALAAASGLPGGATQRLALELKARLVSGGRTLAERTIRREAEALAGADALDGEAWRAQALARLADDAARALLDALEE
jgi:hypothetical protein